MSTFPMNKNRGCGCGSHKPHHTCSSCSTENKPQSTCTIRFRHTGVSRVWRPDTGCNQRRHSDNQRCLCDFEF